MNGFRTLSKGSLKRELESFNNCYVTGWDNTWMYFKATPFAVRGIISQLERKVEALTDNEYRILITNIPFKHQ
jgi:hypothetical protein